MGYLSVKNAGPTHHGYKSPSILSKHTSHSKKSPTKTNLIQHVATSTLKEVAITCAFTAVSCAFIATPAGHLILLATAGATLSLNLLIRCVHATALYRLGKIKNSYSNSSSEEYLLKKCLTVTSWFCAYNFASFDNMTRDTITHEAGHALAFKALWRKSHPKITLFPGEGGQTEAGFRGLTRLGKWLGKAKSELVISGAGTGLALGASLVNLVVSHKIRKKHPQASRYLTCMVAMSFFHHITYALSALIPALAIEGHDFVALAQGGIHPLAAAVVMISLPILVKAGLCFSDAIAKRRHAHRKYKPQLKAAS